MMKIINDWSKFIQPWQESRGAVVPHMSMSLFSYVDPDKVTSVINSIDLF